METMQIPVNDVLGDFLKKEAAKHGFASATEYVQSLLADLETRVRARKELDAKLLEGIRSPGVLVDQAFWAERRRKILEKHPELNDAP